MVKSWKSLRAVFKCAVHKNALTNSKVSQVGVTTECYYVFILVVGQQKSFCLLETIWLLIESSCSWTSLWDFGSLGKCFLLSLYIALFTILMSPTLSTSNCTNSRRRLKRLPTVDRLSTCFWNSSRTCGWWKPSLSAYTSDSAIFPKLRLQALFSIGKTQDPLP